MKLNSSEFAQFKNINVNVRGVQHRQIVITQAEKLRDGFFLKTKTQVLHSVNLYVLSHKLLFRGKRINLLIGRWTNGLVLDIRVTQSISRHGEIA